MDNNLKIAAIIPCFNTTLYISEVVSQTKSFVDEVIVVDDGSTDDTAKVAEAVGARVIKHETNQGKGLAMKTGARNTDAHLIIFLDGDSQHNPEDIPALVSAIFQGNDLAIGSRHLGKSKVVSPSFSRRITNIMASKVISFFTLILLPIIKSHKMRKKQVATGNLIRDRIKITDCTSGFRAITRDAWNKLNLSSDGFEIETEMIYEAVKHDLKILEVPISCHWKTTGSRLSIFRDGFKTIKLLLNKLYRDLRNE